LYGEEVPMPDIPITVASGDYDRVRGLREGTVGIAGCAVAYSTVEANALFVRNLKHHEFDVSEMSFSTYITLKARGAHHYTAVPAFLSRAFRHSAIFVRSDRIASPAGLKGKRVGTPEYLTTMLVWMRGLLSDEYGIAPSDLRWRLGGLEQPSTKPGAPDPVVGVDIENIPAGKTLSGMLADGEIDAIFSARPPSCFVKGAPDVGRLFADTRAVEQAYYKRSGVYPLMHAVGIRNSLLDAHPWMARAVLDAFSKAKEMALAELQKLAAFAVTLPWVEAEYRATQAVLGNDIWPYGVVENRKAIDTLCRYLHEQGFTPRRMGVDELFAPM
jgi:4,5-dihydroxyphthalate decarboxylase